MPDDPVNAFVPHTPPPIDGNPSGPLAGLTFAVKDLYDTVGDITGGGNPEWLASHAPARHTSPLVARLLDAGADMVRHFPGVGLHQRRFRPRRVVFLDPANGVEQLRPFSVIEIFARQLFLLGAKAAQNIIQERLRGFVNALGGNLHIHDLQASSARRKPLNCQRSGG